MSSFMTQIGWSHNPEVAGSNPAPRYWEGRAIVAGMHRPNGRRETWIRHPASRSMATVGGTGVGVVTLLRDFVTASRCGVR
jgi:hypothetical protein